MREEFYQARDYLLLTVHEIRKYLELDDYYYQLYPTSCFTQK